MTGMKLTALVKDRRVEPRSAAVLRLALIVVDGCAQLCRVTNISSQGLQATVFQHVAMGSKVRLYVGDQLPVAGVIIWSSERSIGIKLNQELPGLAQTRLECDPLATLSRRRVPRVCVSARASLTTGDRKFGIALLDISPTGAMVESQQPLPGLCPIQLQVPDLGQIDAQIRWIDGTRAGVLFNKPLRLDLLSRWLDRTPER